MPASAVTQFAPDVRIPTDCVATRTVANRATTSDTDTAIFVNTIKEHAREDIQAKHPLFGVGDPNHMVGAAIFLASDDARWITGVCLPVDGGYVTQ